MECTGLCFVLTKKFYYELPTSWIPSHWYSKFKTKQRQRSSSFDYLINTGIPLTLRTRVVKGAAVPAQQFKNIPWVTENTYLLQCALKPSYSHSQLNACE